MSRKLLALLVAALLLLSLATYVYYRRTLASVPIDPYALVPDDAVLVLATRDHPALVRHLQEAGVWDNISGVRYFQQVAGQLALADSLDTGGNPSPAARQRRGLLSLLGRKLVLTSVHLTGPGQVDVLYQIPLATVREYRQARGLLETLGRDARYTLSTRDYEGYELQELTAREGGGRLTVLNYRNHLLLSTHAPLVEAAVQRLQLPADAPTVRAGFADTDLLRLRDVDATLLLNFRRLPGLLDVLFRPGTHAQLDQAATLAREALLGLKIEPSQLLLTGFANPETAARSWHQQLRTQPTQPLRTLADVLTLRTALVLAVAGPLATPPAPTTLAVPTAMADSADQPARAALDSLRAALGPGLALAYLAAPAPAVAPARLVLARCAAPARVALWLARLRRLTGVSPGFVRMGAFNVYGAGFTAEQLAPALLPPLAGGAGPAQSAALVRDYLVLGEPAALQAYLAEVAAGATWSRSAAQVALLQQTLPQARLTVLADTRQGWNALLGYLAEERRAGLLRNESLLKHFPQIAWQLFPTEEASDAARPAPGASDGQYYAQLVLRRPGQGAAAGTEVGAAAGNPRFRTALVGQPLLLPATPDDPAPAVVADSLGVLRLLSSRANVALWADTLPGPVVAAAAPHLVRGRLLLATAHRLHWLSPADGQQAPGFPLNLPDSVTIAAVATAPTPRPVPHLLVATTNNDLLLLDASGRQYPGWPRRLEAPLAGPPLLLVVGGRDVIVAALRNGYVYAFTQAGERYPGFPVSAGAHLSGPLLAQPAATLARSVLRLVNQHGELLSLTLSGDITSRRRVATWSRTATFSLVPEAYGRPGAFVVVREDGGRVDVYNPAVPTTAPLLSRQLLTSGPKPVQWFDFGGGHQVLALTEPGPAQVSLFDGQGRPLGGAATGPASPWPSTGTGVALRLDAARRRYLLVRVLAHELRRDALAVP
ncbi:hypothetical protein [Hymenobacter bucti]|uniref:DUF3352 domain-containing protein n=1 Tax=Hymenobacter bucti TaxID=1844114 RepID=A0ABW4R0P5_9BACT